MSLCRPTGRNLPETRGGREGGFPDWHCRPPVCQEWLECLLPGFRHPRLPLSRRLVLLSVSKGHHGEQTPRQELIEARARAEEA